MRNFSIRLTSEQNGQLEALSVKSGDSKADHIRFAVERYLADPQEPSTAPDVPQFNRRLVELIEFTAMTIDELVQASLGPERRDKILDKVSVNLDQFHG